MTFQLEPGEAIYVPVMAPHHVKNGPEPSISLSITWRSEWSFAEADARAFNGCCARWGFDPRPPGRWPARNRAKAIAWRALRRLPGHRLTGAMTPRKAAAMATIAAPLPTPEQLVAELVLLLDLEPRGGDRFVGRKQTEGTGRVFGGQAIAQALVAARRTVPDDRHDAFAPRLFPARRQRRAADRFPRQARPRRAQLLQPPGRRQPAGRADPQPDRLVPEAAGRASSHQYRGDARRAAARGSRARRGDPRGASPRRCPKGRCAR